MKFYLSPFIDTLFSSFITFVLSFSLFCFFLPREFSILYGACLSLLLSLLYFKFFYSRKNHAKILSSEKKEKNDVITTLNFSTMQKNTTLFDRALIKDGRKTERKLNGIFLKDENSAIFVRFSIEPVTKVEILKIFNAIPKNYTAYVLSETFSSQVKDFSARFHGSIKLIGGDECYLYLKEKDCLPKENPITMTAPKTKPKLTNLFLRKKAKSFLVIGFFSMLFAYISPLKIYHTVFGSIFLLLSLFCLFFGKAE